jgi:hypothetical protein
MATLLIEADATRCVDREIKRGGSIMWSWVCPFAWGLLRKNNADYRFLNKKNRVH